MKTILAGTIGKTKKCWHWYKVVDETWNIAPRHKTLCGAIGYGVQIEDITLPECRNCLRLYKQIKRAETIADRLLK